MQQTHKQKHRLFLHMTNCILAHYANTNGINKISFSEQQFHHVWLTVYQYQKNTTHKLFVINMPLLHKKHQPFHLHNMLVKNLPILTSFGHSNTLHMCASNYKTGFPNNVTEMFENRSVYSNLLLICGKTVGKLFRTFKGSATTVYWWGRQHCNHPMSIFWDAVYHKVLHVTMIFDQLIQNRKVATFLGDRVYGKQTRLGTWLCW